MHSSLEPGATSPLAYLTSKYSGQDNIIRQLVTLFPAKSPSFIYIQDTFDFVHTRQLVGDVLTALSEDSIEDKNVTIFAWVNCVTCFTQKLLFDTVISSLYSTLCRDEYRPHKINGAGRAAWRDGFDSFIHSLQYFYSRTFPSDPSSRIDGNFTKIVVVFERVDRLKETLPELIVPLSRLQELTGVNITSVFLAEKDWECVAPLPGTLTDPYRISLASPSKQDIIDRIVRRFPLDRPLTSLTVYNPILQPLFAHFVQTVYDVCVPFVAEPEELAYIASVRWPGFALPIVNGWKMQNNEKFQPPTEDERIRLTKMFNPSLIDAVESLFPRAVGALEWSHANSLPDGHCLSQTTGLHAPQCTYRTSPATAIELPKRAMFILLAAFIASYNPSKTDHRILSKDADQKMRRKNKGGATRKVRTSAASKVPHHLLGPLAFPYDRLMAILGSLLQEYDETSHTTRTLSGISENSMEIEVYRVQTQASIQELIAMRLLYKTSPKDRLEGVTFKCALSHEQASLFARKLGIPLNELLWEAN